jgi:hypothetical protein
MSFINNSVNYSQTNCFKTNILQPLLKLYNNFLLNNNLNQNLLKTDVNTGLSLDYLIPNNNKKYYLLITSKQKFENVKDNYNIFYFFPDQSSFNAFKNNKIITNTIQDFFLETNNLFSDEYLFEGYLYKKNDKYSYLLTDILIKNSNVIDLNYELRYTLLNEIMLSIPRGSLNSLNNNMSINIHPIFNHTNENLIKIFKNNFVFRHELCSIEKINNTNKEQIFESVSEEHKDEHKDEHLKFIERGKYTDVYNVFNHQSNNFEGILYVKGLKESKYLIELFKNSNNTRILLKCKYNINFTKWQPIY